MDLISFNLDTALKAVHSFSSMADSFAVSLGWHLWSFRTWRTLSHLPSPYSALYTFTMAYHSDSVNSINPTLKNRWSKLQTHKQLKVYLSSWRKIKPESLVFLLNYMITVLIHSRDTEPQLSAHMFLRKFQLYLPNPTACPLNQEWVHKPFTFSKDYAIFKSD